MAEKRPPRLRGRIAAVLAAVSLVILAAGAWNCAAVLQNSSMEWLRDPVTGLLYYLMALVVCFAVMRYFFLAVLVIWAAYGAVLLAVLAVEKVRRSGHR